MGCCRSAPQPKAGTLAAEQAAGAFSADVQPKTECDGPSLENDYQELVVKKIGDVLGNQPEPVPATKKALPSTKQTRFSYAPSPSGYYKGGTMIMNMDGVFGVIESNGCLEKISRTFEALMVEDIRRNSENLAEALKTNYSLVQQMIRSRRSDFLVDGKAVVTFAVVQQGNKNHVSILIPDSTKMAFLARKGDAEIKVVREFEVGAGTLPCFLGHQEGGREGTQTSPTILSSEFKPGDLFVMMNRKLDGERLTSFCANNPHTFYPSSLLKEIQGSTDDKSAFVILAQLPGEV